MSTEDIMHFLFERHIRQKVKQRATQILSDSSSEDRISELREKLVPMYEQMFVPSLTINLNENKIEKAYFKIPQINNDFFPTLYNNIRLYCEMVDDEKRKYIKENYLWSIRKLEDAVYSTKYFKDEIKIVLNKADGLRGETDLQKFLILSRDQTKSRDNKSYTYRL